MTLKELRISKGLSQSACAAYLGMSVRNYQNYENGDALINTARYNAIVHKLEEYGKADRVSDVIIGQYRTNVVTGISLQALTHSVEKYDKRDCYGILKQFMERETDGRICILYGLRRTGKTTMLFQMINELPYDQCAYIKIRTSDNMSYLSRDLEMLFYSGYRYVFIDEVTLMEDFINTAALLSDIFASMGMKIVVSGTDSLGFAMTDRDELYDRSVMVHTSFIPFREYSRLLGIDSIDTYIEYGGTLKKENMGFDDPDHVLDDVSFRDDESTRKYIDTSISRNIQHTLRNDGHGEYFNQLRELYDKGELTNVINRIVESMNHQFLLKVVEDRFISHDLGSARELMLHELPDPKAHILYDIDRDAVVDRLKKLIDVKERNETGVKVTQEHIDKVRKYLYMLDLIMDCSERYESKGQGEYVVFTQPGMRYAIAKALVYSLMQDEYFVSCPERDRSYIAAKILEDVKGRMLEDIVLLETSKAVGKDKEAFRFKFDNGGEYDMVIYDRKEDSCTIYEVKHSDQIADKQTRHLRNEEKNGLVERRFGMIKGRYVLYRGDNIEVDGIKYLNVEEYLKGLKRI